MCDADFWFWMILGLWVVTIALCWLFNRMLVNERAHNLELHRQYKRLWESNQALGKRLGER